MDKNLKETPQSPQIDANRRRLTKAGLAAPAVLGILASRSVLAEVPWKCTISGQISGNMSGHENETCSLGDSQSVLQSRYPLVGTDPTKVKTLFGDLKKSLLYIDDFGNLTKASQGNKEATVNQILNLYVSPGSALEYAQKALVLLLNSRSLTDTSTYPLTEYQAIKLYVATVNETAYSDTNPTVNWPYSHVTSYIDVLWH